MGARSKSYKQSLSRRCCILVGVFIFLVSDQASVLGQADANTSTASNGAQAKEPKLTFRGTGKKREILVRGRFVDANKKSLQNVQLAARLKKSPGGLALEPVVTGEAFELWVPIGHTDWSWLGLTAISEDKSLRTYRGFANWKFRKAALEGIELVLREPKREVTVTVTHEKKPVANAQVVVESIGNSLRRSKTDANGQTTFSLFDHEGLNQLTAWTDDKRIGGYSFDRSPPRDPRARNLEVELDRCRDQRIRIVDADSGSPIPKIDFILTIGTGKPSYNFAATENTMPQLLLTTNSEGETSCPWFPDWEKHGSYIEFMNHRWIRIGDLKADQDGVLVQAVRPRSVRKKMQGKVVSSSLDVNGLLVVCSTFQDEEESRSDRQYAFTDEEGSFSADCIAGATYCVYVSDADHVSNTIDTIPLDLKTGKSNSPTVELMQAALVEIRLTEGPKRKPMVNQWINVSSPYSFDWEEDGETKSGRGGRHWGVTTDESGIARTKALAGSAFRATVYAGSWSSGDNKTTVKKDGVTVIEIHRKVDEAREIKGRLIAPPDSDVNLANAEVTIGGVDGQSHGQSKTKTDKDGQFVVQSQASEYAIFAYSSDGKAAGSISRVDEGPVEIVLSPTMDYRGQLVDRSKRPVAGHPVWANVYVKGSKRWNFQTMNHDTKYSAHRFETVTDSDGIYTFKNVPADLEMRVYTREQSLEDPDDDTRRLGNVTLRIGKPQPLKVDRIRVENDDF